ncbi:MAG: hypothetical protein OXU74_11230 [Gemmatimonadota bacterium]|nr:hypothetical protein [Gemmatimonadota bacterium]
MSNDDHPTAEMLAGFVSGPIPMEHFSNPTERFLDKDEALGAYYAESRTRCFVLETACSHLSESAKAELVSWLWTLVRGLEEILPPTSRYTRLDAAMDETRRCAEWLVDLD